MEVKQENHFYQNPSFKDFLQLYRDICTKAAVLEKDRGNLEKQKKVTVFKYIIKTCDESIAEYNRNVDFFPNRHNKMDLLKKIFLANFTILAASVLFDSDMYETLSHQRKFKGKLFSHASGIVGVATISAGLFSGAGIGLALLCGATASISTSMIAFNNLPQSAQLFGNLLTACENACQPSFPNAAEFESLSNTKDRTPPTKQLVQPHEYKQYLDLAQTHALFRDSAEGKQGYNVIYGRWVNMGDLLSEKETADLENRKEINIYNNAGLFFNLVSKITIASCYEMLKSPLNTLIWEEKIPEEVPTFTV